MTAVIFLTALAFPPSVCAEGARKTEHVILVTLDGLRWQELFSGAELRLLNQEHGGVRDVDAVKRQFWSESPDVRRKLLMPFLWSLVAAKGQIFGDPNKGCIAKVTNGRFFSYPGYNELLTGAADDRIDSNRKRPNQNITVLEWLNRKPMYRGRVAAFCSWDVLPYIINAERSGVYVNAGWQDLATDSEPQSIVLLNQLSRELPRYWPNVRYDIFTALGALGYLKNHKPRVLYVAFGETDDWAHDGRYDLYLDAAHRTDDYIRQLWESAQNIPSLAGRTSLIITTDHGRGNAPVGWKSHGAKVPGSDRIWIAILGPDTPPRGVREGVPVTQGQVAATVAALLGEAFQNDEGNAAPPLPGVLAEGSR